LFVHFCAFSAYASSNCKALIAAWFRTAGNLHQDFLPYKLKSGLEQGKPNKKPRELLALSELYA
jgi:hypothetical protein